MRNELKIASKASFILARILFPQRLLAIVLSPLLTVHSGTVFRLTLDPHKLCLFSVTV